MDHSTEAAASEAKDVYSRAIAGGATIHVAFDLACTAYHRLSPALEGQALRLVVATGIGLAREDRIAIEIGKY